MCSFLSRSLLLLQVDGATNSKFSPLLGSFLLMTLSLCSISSAIEVDSLIACLENNFPSVPSFFSMRSSTPTGEQYPKKNFITVWASSKTFAIKTCAKVSPQFHVLVITIVKRLPINTAPIHVKFTVTCLKETFFCNEFFLFQVLQF